MSHSVHHSQTDIRECHSGNILCHSHTIACLGICRFVDCCFQITSYHFNGFDLEHIAHFPSSFGNQPFDGMCQSIQSGGSGQAFRQGVHQLCIHNSYSRNIIRIDAYHFLFVNLIRNHVIDCHFGSSSGSSRQGNDGNGFLFCIRHTFQRNNIAEFRIVSNNSDSFCGVY